MGDCGAGLGGGEVAVGGGGEGQSPPLLQPTANS